MKHINGMDSKTADKLKGIEPKDNCPSCEYHKQSERVWRDFAKQQHAEIKELKAVLEQEGIGVGRDLLNGGIALFRKAQEK